MAASILADDQIVSLTLDVTLYGPEECFFFRPVGSVINQRVAEARIASLLGAAAPVWNNCTPSSRELVECASFSRLGMPSNTAAYISKSHILLWSKHRCGLWKLRHLRDRWQGFSHPTCLRTESGLPRRPWPVRVNARYALQCDHLSATLRCLRLPLDFIRPTTSFNFSVGCA